MDPGTAWQSLSKLETRDGPTTTGQGIEASWEMADSRAKSGKAENELEPSWKPERKEMIKGHWEHIKKI